MNMKKALLAGAILTAFATTAFAADIQEDNKPTMRERVNKILHHEDEHPGYHKNAKRGYPPRPKMTKEQRERFKQMNPEERRAFMKERHAQWLKSMTPEQKAHYNEHQKFLKERKEARQKNVAEKMNKLTAAQRAEVEQFIKDEMAHHRAMGERLKKMSPEQREAIRACRPKTFGHHFDKKAPGHKMKHHREYRDFHRDFHRGPQADCPVPPCV